MTNRTLRVSSITGRGPLPSDLQTYEVHLEVVEEPGGAAFSASIRFQTKDAQWLARHILDDLRQRGLG